MKKITIAMTLLALAIGCGLLFAQQAPPPAAGQYSAQTFLVMTQVGVSIIDHAKNKTYIYFIDKEGKTMHLASTIDLTKAGQQQFACEAAPPPARGK